MACEHFRDITYPCVHGLCRLDDPSLWELCACCLSDAPSASDTAPYGKCGKEKGSDDVVRFWRNDYGLSRLRSLQDSIREERGRARKTAKLSLAMMIALLITGRRHDRDQS